MRITSAVCVHYVRRWFGVSVLYNSNISHYDYTGKLIFLFLLFISFWLNLQEVEKQVSKRVFSCDVNLDVSGKF